MEFPVLLKNAKTTIHLTQTMSPKTEWLLKEWSVKGVPLVAGEPETPYFCVSTDALIAPIRQQSVDEQAYYNALLPLQDANTFQAYERARYVGVSGQNETRQRITIQVTKADGTPANFVNMYLLFYLCAPTPTSSNFKAQFIY